ncbi:hypothetical protein ACFXG4_39365 [Nocardia sp. NPDC059246]|uniref:hypothetical protein n=1 Tax=unclassified Nocardia TaxID=2637762 RepID=UPI00367D874E
MSSRQSIDPAEAGHLVSIDLDPVREHDTYRTIAEAEMLWWLVDRPSDGQNTSNANIRRRFHR